MWYLTSDVDQRVIYILSSKDITIGRSIDANACSFPIYEDSSISRKHAVLSIEDDALHVQDLGSRYGTSINDCLVKIECNKKVKLIDGDVVKFGKLNSVWKVMQVQHVTCTSTLKGENLQNLKLVLSKLGALFLNEWNESCTFLTMPAITLTIKVVLALVQGIHIVKPEFWFKCLEAVQSNSKLPDPTKYIPQVVESTLNKEIVSFVPSSERKIIFEGKQFIFFSRCQLDMYRPVLVKSSATPLLLSESRMTKSMLCNSNVIVIQYNIGNITQETQAQKNQIDDIINYLKGKGKRVVADAEIGLAILYCSTEKYCNPDFNFSSEVVRQPSGVNSKAPSILALESQDKTLNVTVKKENVVIDESVVSNNDCTMNTSTKRKCNDDFDQHGNVNKKLATGANLLMNKSSENCKRKLDEEDIVNHPAKKMAVHESEDDMFKFVSATDSKENDAGTEKLLNISKPHKRKHDSGVEDDLFNFIQKKPEPTERNSHEKKLGFTEDSNTESISKSNAVVEPDIKSLRGAKLSELMNSNLKVSKNIKQECSINSDDLDKKMSNLDLGFTVVTIKTNLVVKKEPIVVQEPITQGKNFKKFKKVWPNKMQVTVNNTRNDKENDSSLDLSEFLTN